MTRRRVYVACSLRRAQEAVELARALRAAGHVVVSTWHEKENLDAIMNTSSLRTQGNSSEAERDYREVMDSDLLIVLAMPSGVRFYGGGHVCEFGIAVGAGIETVVVGDRSCVFYHLPQTTVVATAEEAVRLLSREDEHA